MRKRLPIGENWAVELAAMFVAGYGVVEVFGVAVSSVSPAIGQMKPA